MAFSWGSIARQRVLLGFCGNRFGVHCFVEPHLCCWGGCGRVAAGDGPISCAAVAHISLWHFSGHRQLIFSLCVWHACFAFSLAPSLGFCQQYFAFRQLSYAMGLLWHGFGSSPPLAVDSGWCTVACSTAWRANLRSAPRARCVRVQISFVGCMFVRRISLQHFNSHVLLGPRHQPCMHQRSRWSLTVLVVCSRMRTQRLQQRTVQ